MSDASSKRPGNTWSRHSRAGAAALLALLFGFFCVGYPFGMARAAADTSTTVRVSLNANAPAVSSAGESVTVTGTLTNTGSQPIEHPVVHVSVGERVLLDTRTAADRWMSGKLDDVPLTEVAHAASAPGGSSASSTLGAGSSTSFAVDIPGKKLKFSYGLASLPMAVTVTEGASSEASAIRGTARSALHLQNGAVRSPLEMTVVIPLTLPADPNLFGPSGASRAAAWEHAVGPESTVQRTLDALQGEPVVFAVDPALLDPPAAADDNVPSAAASASASSSSRSSATSSGPASESPDTGSTTPDPTSTTDTGTTDTGSAASGGTPSGDQSGSQSGAATDGATGATGTSSPESPSSSSSAGPPSTPQGKIDAAVASLTDRLNSLDDTQSVWWLPSDDPDLTALQALGSRGRQLAGRDFSRPLPHGVAALGDTRLVWPTGDLAGSAVAAYTKDFRTRSKSPAVALLPSRALPAADDATATHRAGGTSGVLTYDEQLSAVFSAATTSPGAQTSRLLTQSMALYLQSPGTKRSLALVAPRTGGAGPSQLAAQVSALRTAGWVSLRSGTKTTSALHTAPHAALLKAPRKNRSDPKPPRPAVTAPELVELSRSRTRLAALQSVLVGGSDVIPPRQRGLDIVGSTRWRGATAKLAAVADRDNTAVSAMLHKLSVRSSTINFFADSGDISVTVSNELNRPVHGLQLDVERHTYLIRVTEPVKTVDIDAGSRATTHLHIEAVGSGTVPLDAVLRAPDGTPLTDTDAPSQLKINVHPTSGWIMWVLGVLAGLVLVIGLWRAVRRGPRTVSAPASTDAPTPGGAIVDAGQKPKPQQDPEQDDQENDEQDEAGND